MNQANTRSERNTSSRSSARGAIASKSREAAEVIENGVAERVEQVRTETDRAKEQAAERISRVATQLKSLGDNLREQDTLAANLADRASDGIERVADYVRSSDARALVRDAEQLARQRPSWFFGGAFLVGLAAGRFLKSSRPEGSISRPRRFDDDGPGRFGPERGSAGRGSRAEWSAQFGDEAERGTRDTSQERLRQNYDAAFGRDMSSDPATPQSPQSPQSPLGASSGARSGSSLGERPNTVQPQETRPIDPTRGSGS